MKIKAPMFFFLSLGTLFASELKVVDDQTFASLHETSSPQEIARVLGTIGVRFEQWEAGSPVSSASTEEEIKEAYRADIERLQRENGFQSVDVVSLFPDNPKKREIRAKYLNEHTHSEDEVRFFVQGSGVFFLHCEGKVFSVLCEKGDLISIPPEYPHWFDMGADPYFTAIRFFTRTDGWIAHFTGDPIASHFVSVDEPN